MWLCCLPPSHAPSVSLWWSVIRCGQWMCIWIPKKHTFHMLPISFEWLFSLVKVLLSLSLQFFLTFLHFSVSIFHFYYKNSPLLKVARPSPIAAVLKIIITHITIFFSSRFISGWTMQKIKTLIPKSHEHAHCLKICYWELNPYHFVRRMNRLPFKSRSNAWIWASELWKRRRRRAA